MAVIRAAIGTSAIRAMREAKQIRDERLVGLDPADAPGVYGIGIQPPEAGGIITTSGTTVAEGVKVGLTMPSPPDPAWLKHYIETGETP